MRYDISEGLYTKIVVHWLLSSFPQKRDLWVRILCVTLAKINYKMQTQTWTLICLPNQL